MPYVTITKTDLLESDRELRARIIVAEKPAACGDCGASPCDCAAEIWSFRYRNRSNGADWWWGGNAVVAQKAGWAFITQAWRACETAQGRVYEFGPVQRTTDPPYEFPKACSVTVDVHNTVPAGGLPPDHGKYAHWFSPARLARLLWETNPRVTAFIAQVSDSILREGPGEYVIDAGRASVARERAWTRDEGNWRSEAEIRAAAIFAEASK
jgi:hypothetical protein